MRTTIDLPDELMKKAKVEAIKEGITLKEFFTRMLMNELNKPVPGNDPPPWKQLQGSGSASALQPEDTPFDDYSGPDWPHSMQVNEPG